MASMVAIVFPFLLATGLAAPPYMVMLKGPVSFTDHFAASVMKPSQGSSPGSTPTQAVPQLPRPPNPPQAPRPPSTDSSSSNPTSFTKNETYTESIVTTGKNPRSFTKNETYTESIVTGNNPCPKDMVQSANLNAIEVIERDACCPNSIGVFAGPSGCCALEHKSCTHTARCCDSSLECNTVAGATMLTCERPSVFTGQDTTPSSADKTTPVSNSGSDTSINENFMDQVSGK